MVAAGWRVSNRLLDLVWRTDIGPATKRLVLLALADAANEDGTCWPSVGLLMERTGAGKTAVVAALGELEADGVLSKKRRRQQSTVYVVDADALSTRIRKVQNPEGSESETLGSRTFEGSDPEPPKVQIPNLPKENPQRTLKEPSPRRATQLPKSWQPTEEHATRAATLGVDLADEVENFRLHAETHARTAKNWNSAFTTWLKKAPAMAGPRRRPAAPGPLTADAATEWLRAEWHAGRTRPITERTGLAYHPPDLPLDVAGKDAVEQFLRDAARTWITTNRDRILTRLTHRSAS